ncbi:MAG: hypothetical protein RJB66_1677 [Pseudomonadota bacterium]|jgi:dTDP-glucose 4,6-dehydratase
MIVTGAAGFIGSSFLRLLFRKNIKMVVVDNLTYAGHEINFEGLTGNPSFDFIKGDIADRALMASVFEQHRPKAILNFAAESSVDRAIASPELFIHTNILGTHNLLEAAQNYYLKLTDQEKNDFVFLQVSTDEVFGSLEEHAQAFSETSSYSPRSPYSATKAAADHLVKAWFHTFGLPTIVTHCSNNYGPRQLPEKLIPRMILSALRERSLSVYGSGLNIRDWIHVEDHCDGIWAALMGGKPGESYCFGGGTERRNIEIIEMICKILDSKQPRPNGKSYLELISFVEDRAGHDFRYAVDDSKARKELNYKPNHQSFEESLASTIDWYLNNRAWIQTVESKVTLFA